MDRQAPMISGGGPMSDHQAANQQVAHDGARAAARGHVAIEALGELRPPDIRHRAPEHRDQQQVASVSATKYTERQHRDCAACASQPQRQRDEHRGERDIHDPQQAACAARAAPATSSPAASRRTRPEPSGTAGSCCARRLRAPVPRESGAACSSRRAGRRRPPRRRSMLAVPRVSQRLGAPAFTATTSGFRSDAASRPARRAARSPCRSRSSQRCSISQAGM